MVIYGRHMFYVYRPVQSTVCFKQPINVLCPCVLGCRVVLQVRLTCWWLCEWTANGGVHPWQQTILQW
jgi:hypothetical protein